MSDALTDGLVEGIPLAEAAGFFINVKTAHAVAVEPAELSDEFVKTAESKLQRKIAELVAGVMPEGKAGYNKAAPPIDLTEKTAGLTKKQILELMSDPKFREKMMSEARRAGTTADVGKKIVGPAALAAGVAGGAYLTRDKKASHTPGHKPTLGQRLKQIEEKERGKLTAVHRESSALRVGAPAAGAGAALGAGAAALLKKSPKRGAAIGAALAGAAGGAYGGLKGHKKGETVSKNIARMRRKAIVESALRRRGARHALKDKDVRQLKALGYSLRQKTAEGPGGLQQDPQQEGAPAQQQPGAGQQPQQQGEQTPQAAPPPTMPTNYLTAEIQARQAQQEGESGYYRALLEQATAENQMSQTQLQEMGAQLQQLQQQGQQTGMQIEQATQQAVEAQDRATEHSQQAANMRMGMQKMREQMMQIASQDPDTFAPMPVPQAPMGELNQPMQDSQGGQPQSGAQQSAQAGQPGNTGEPGGGAPPGSTGPQGAGSTEGSEAKSDGKSANPKKDGDTAKPQVQIKTSALLERGGKALGRHSEKVEAAQGAMSGATGGAAAGGLGGAVTGGISLAVSQSKKDAVVAAVEVFDNKWGQHLDDPIEAMRNMARNPQMRKDFKNIYKATGILKSMKRGALITGGIMGAAGAGIGYGKGRFRRGYRAGQVEKAEEKLKTSAALPVIGGAIAGGLMGAAEGATMGSQVPQLEQKVEQMGQDQGGGFTRAVRFAQAKAKLDIARSAQENPGMSALKGGAMGAMVGAGVGAGGRTAVQNIKTMFT